MKLVRTILTAVVPVWIIWGLLSPALTPGHQEGVAAAGLIPARMAVLLGDIVVNAQDAKPQGDIPLLRARFFGLRIDPRTNQPVVELLNDDNTRILPIWIGLNEAIAIEMENKKISPPRPMTHDLIVNILNGLGARVNQIVIHDLREGTFYAYISLSLGDRDYAVDSRPSDAIALSLRVGAPIYVASRIFADYGIEVSKDVAADALKELLSADVQELTPDLASSFGLKTTDGVLVAGVEPEGKAAGGGLQRGDVIIEAGGEHVANVSQLAARLKALTGKGPIPLKVHRQGKEVELTMEP